MATFSYIAKNASGADARGTVEAASADAAREELRKKGFMIEDLKELPPVAAPAKPKAAPLPWAASSNAAPVKTAPEAAAYAPLHETLRVFAGWLLAWYGLIYALGFLEFSGKLPAIPFVHELFESRLVLQFTFGTFLLLALSNAHRWLGRGVLAGFVLAVLYAALLAGFVVYG